VATFLPDGAEAVARQQVAEIVARKDPQLTQH
jgi:hypothetical protein